MSETIGEKASRYLVEGRLIVTRVDEERIAARCRGAGAVYLLGFDGPDGWWCSCPARHACAHVLALQLVTCAPEEAAA